MKIELGIDELDRVVGGRFQIQATTSGSSLDSNMQMVSFSLKQSAEKFSELTGVVQTIMQSNNDIFGKIAGAKG